MSVESPQYTTQRSIVRTEGGAKPFVQAGDNACQLTPASYLSCRYITLLTRIATLQLQGESPTYILDEDTQPVIRAIGVSHTACKDEFRQNPRSHSWSVFPIFIIEYTWCLVSGIHGGIIININRGHIRYVCEINVRHNIRHRYDTDTILIGYIKDTYINNSSIMRVWHRRVRNNSSSRKAPAPAATPAAAAPPPEAT